MIITMTPGNNGFYRELAEKIYLHARHFTPPRIRCIPFGCDGPVGDFSPGISAGDAEAFDKSFKAGGLKGIKGTLKTHSPIVNCQGAYWQPDVKLGIYDFFVKMEPCGGI